MSYVTREIHTRQRYCTVCATLGCNYHTVSLAVPFFKLFNISSWDFAVATQRSEARVSFIHPHVAAIDWLIWLNRKDSTGSRKDPCGSCSHVDQQAGKSFAIVWRRPTLERKTISGYSSDGNVTVYTSNVDLYTAQNHEASLLRWVCWAEITHNNTRSSGLILSESAQLHLKHKFGVEITEHRKSQRDRPSERMRM